MGLVLHSHEQDPEPDCKNAKRTFVEPPAMTTPVIYTPFFQIHVSSGKGLFVPSPERESVILQYGLIDVCLLFNRDTVGGELMDIFPIVSFRPPLLKIWPSEPASQVRMSTSTRVSMTT